MGDNSRATNSQQHYVPHGSREGLELTKECSQQQCWLLHSSTCCSAGRSEARRRRSHQKKKKESRDSRPTTQPPLWTFPDPAPKMDSHSQHKHFDHGDHARRAEQKRGAVEIRSGASNGGTASAIGAVLGVGSFSCFPQEDRNHLCFCKTEPSMDGAQESSR